MKSVTQEIPKYILSFSLLLLAFSTTCANPAFEDTKVLEGRWDMTISMNGKELPSWLEVQHSGIKTLVGRFVYAGGSARPISKVNFKDGKFSFTIHPSGNKKPEILSLKGW